MARKRHAYLEEVKPESLMDRAAASGDAVSRRSVFSDYKKMAKGLAEFLGPSCEVVLHDFRNLERSIVAIEGSVTERSVGGPVTELLLHLLKAGKTRENLFNLRSSTSSGKPLKSAIFFIHDDAGNAIGALCLNYDLSAALMYQQVLDDFVQAEPGRAARGSEPGEDGREPFGKDVQDTLDEIMRDALGRVGKPVHLMKKRDKFLVTRYAEERGVFLLKGAADRVAEILRVSPFTIYNYLREIRNSKGT